MNAAELTALHIDTLAAMNAEARTARTLQNIARRAEILLNDGYTATETMSGLYVRTFQVAFPEGNGYRVKISKTPAAPGSFFGSSCSCPCFAEYATCKHFQAVDLMLRDEAQAAEYDVLHTDADDGAYARF